MVYYILQALTNTIIKKAQLEFNPVELFIIL